MFVKYYTNDFFNKERFKDTLVQKYNVRCAVVDDGVILDRDALNAVPVSLLIEWIRVNLKNINSKLHTREATEQEYNDAKMPRYIMYAAAGVKDKDFTAIFKDDNLSKITDTTDLWKEATGRNGYVVDTTTGEIVYES